MDGKELKEEARDKAKGEGAEKKYWARPWQMSLGRSSRESCER
jgi:hypothetical protein